MNGALRNSRKGEQTSGDPLVSYPIINLGPTTSHVLPKPNHQALQLSSFFSSLYTKERIPVCFRDTFLNWVFPNTGISVSSRQLDFLEDHVSLGYAFGFNWFHLLHMIWSLDMHGVYDILTSFCLSLFIHIYIHTHTLFVSN